MGLDKKFLRYKLQKIKNDRIYKDQDTETKKRIRKENAKYSAEEADAIHSYITGEDEIDAFDNKSYLDNRLPGSLYITPRGQLNIRQVQTNPKSKKANLLRILQRFKTMAKSNFNEAKRLIILKKWFDSLNIIFRPKEIKLSGSINTKGYKTQQGKEEYIGITEDFLVSDIILNTDTTIDSDGNVTPGSITYIRKRIIVKNGLIVGQQIIS
jgi:hypothetical protein